MTFWILALRAFKQIKFLKFEDWKFCWVINQGSWSHRKSKESRVEGKARGVHIILIPEKVQDGRPVWGLENHEEWHVLQQMVFNSVGFYPFFILAPLFNLWLPLLPLLFIFPILYGLDSVLALATGCDWYWYNHFELQAYRNESKEDALGDQNSPVN